MNPVIGLKTEYLDSQQSDLVLNLASFVFSSWPLAIWQAKRLGIEFSKLLTK